MLKVGTAREVRALSNTHISGGGSDGFGNVKAIQSRTTHFNRVRVAWDEGGEGFHDFHVDASVGDRVAIVSDAGKQVGEANLSTGVIRPEKIALGCAWIAAILGSVFMILLYGLGLLLIGGIVFYLRSEGAKRREQVEREVGAYTGRRHAER